MKIGVIGYGYWGPNLVRNFAELEDVEIKWCADKVAERRALVKKRYPIVNATESADEIFGDPEVDAVVVATPVSSHYLLVKRALERGKHVLVEKPMTLTLDDADVMIQTAKRHDVQLMVNVKHSFDPHIRQIREIVQSGELGRLRMLHYWYFADWLYRPRTAEELNPSLGGGVTWRQGPHQFDILRTIAGGMVRSVRAMTGMWDESRPVVGCHAAFLEFEDGTAATAVYSGYDHFNSRELTFGVGEVRSTAEASVYAQGRKTLRQLASGEAETALKRAQRYGGASRAARAPRRSASWVLGGPLIVTFEQGDVRLTPSGLCIYDNEDTRNIPISTETDGRHGIVDQLYEAVVNGRRPSADGLWGKATLEVLLAVLASARERRELFLAHQVPAPD